MKLTFVDAGVLIAAATGRDVLASAAMAILDDPQREFASSVFVRLEVLPKAIHQRRSEEVAFYKEFFSNVTHWPASVSELTDVAEREACRWGLGAIDALHIAAALSVGAAELVTTESPTKPLCRVESLRVVSLRQLQV